MLASRLRPYDVKESNQKLKKTPAKTARSLATDELAGVSTYSTLLYDQTAVGYSKCGTSLIKDLTKDQLVRHWCPCLAILLRRPHPFPAGRAPWPTAGALPSRRWRRRWLRTSRQQQQCRTRCAKRPAFAAHTFSAVFI